MTLICVKCQLPMRFKKTVHIELMNATGPYQLYAADLHECDCGNQVTLSARLPIAEHFQPEYRNSVARLKPFARFWLTRRDKEQYHTTVEAQA